jgi:hypothetical protein
VPILFVLVVLVEIDVGFEDVTCRRLVMSMDLSVSPTFTADGSCLCKILYFLYFLEDVRPVVAFL